METLERFLYSRYRTIFVPLMAVFVRFLYTIHCYVLLYRVVVAKNDQTYWVLTLTLIPLGIETFLVLKIQSGEEWARFSPSILCYLISAVISIWILEQQSISERLKGFEAARSRRVTLGKSNSTNSSELDDREILIHDIGRDVGFVLDTAGWAITMEQVLIFVLIVGKWLVPVEDIPKAQLAQVLLLYIGLGADNSEFLQIFSNKEIIERPEIVKTALILWTLALFQFCLTPFSRSALQESQRKSSVSSRYYDDQTMYQDLEAEEVSSKYCGESTKAEILCLLGAMFLQDLPFFIFRIYLMHVFDVITQDIIFFCCKNMISILLQNYRIAMLLWDDYMTRKHAKDGVGRTSAYEYADARDGAGQHSSRRKQSRKSIVEGMDSFDDVVGPKIYNEY